MKRKFIVVTIIMVLLFCSTGCENVREEDTASDYISAGIEKFNNSNYVSLHFHSESVAESDTAVQGLLDSDIKVVREPFTRRYERVNSYYEGNEEKYSMEYASYMESDASGDWKLYEKTQTSSAETGKWESSGIESKGIKDLGDYYRNELEAYVFMFASNSGTFHYIGEKSEDGKTAVEFAGYFTKESASLCIERYFKKSFESFGQDFAGTHPFTLLAGNSGNTPVSIWFDKESGNPTSVNIDLTEAEQSYNNRLLQSDSSVNSVEKKMKRSFISIDIKEMNSEVKNLAPEELNIHD